tara:strand:+ start:87 stop:269 length:183 start_codon:yes stop_codon:yes gene_type:complete
MVFAYVLFYYVQSVKLIAVIFILLFCPGGGIGRHKGLKIPRRQLRAGSSPAPGTIIIEIV